MSRKKRDVAQGIYALQCIAALQTRFKHPEYAFFEQVANSTGFGGKRWADAIAMGIWPSRGLEIHGFEVKVSRSDFKNEMADPAKAEELQRFCDRWHIVTPRGLLDPEELPKTWGLLEVSEDGKLNTRIAAPELTPQAITRPFVAAILRRHSETWHNALSRARHEGREEGAEKGAPEMASRLSVLQKNHEELVKNVTEFEKASGLRILYGWDLPKIGEAVRVLTDSLHRDSLVDQLERDAKAYRVRLEHIEKDIATIRSVEAKAAE